MPASKQRARTAVITAFVANGVMVGSWAPRIPHIKADLGLSAGALGIALLGPALGTVLAVRLVGGLCARHGSADVTRWFAVAYLLTSWLPGVAPNLGTLWLALLVWGAVMGAMDVAMNSQGVTVEGAYGRPLMSGFHAVWSVGSFAGAVLGGVGAALNLNVAVQQAVIGAALLAPVLITGRSMLPDPPHEPAVHVRRRLRLPERRLVLLGVAAIFALMTEGAVADWSGVLLRDHLHVRGGYVSFAYAAFCVTMTAGRFAGDRTLQVFGRVRCIAAAAVLGAVGVAAGLATDAVPGVVAGFALLGVGLSIMVPVLYSTAADTDGPSGPAIATVAMLGCVGMIAGPSLIGLVGQVTSVQSALLLLPPFTLAAGLLGVIGIRLSGRSRGRTPAAVPG